MINSKRNLISIAAALAIGTTSVSAATTPEYLPLTSADGNNQWVLFGVSGFFGSSGTSTEGSFEITGSAGNVWIDSYDDNASTAIPDNGFGELRALNTTYSPIEVRIDTNGLTAQETDPVRTIYVMDPTGTKTDAPIFAFTYKSVLEGHNLEFSVNSGDVYEFNISTANVYSNPVEVLESTKTTGSGGVSTGTTYNSLVATASNRMLDYNLTNNPVAQYGSGYMDDANSSQFTRFYSYNADAQIWEIYDSRNASGNDFDTLTKGKGYWGKMNLSGGSEVAGLVVGSESVSAANLTSNANLADGWNLLSFGQSNTEIKTSTTGMIVTYVPSKAGTISLYDSSFDHEVNVTTTTSDDKYSFAKKVNYAIALEKARGTLPRVFDLKVFPNSAGNNIAFISNKKFAINDNDQNITTTVTTLAGSTSLWNRDTNDVIAIGDINGTTSGVASVYGEYTLTVQPITEASTVNNLVVPKVRIVVPDVNSSGVTADVTTSLTAAATSINTALGTAVTGGSGKAFAIDYNLDGTDDYVVMAASKPFYVKDQTTVRVYEYDDSAALADGTYVIATATDTTVTNTITHASTAALVAVDLNGTESATYAAVNIPTTDKIAVFTTQDNAQELALLRAYHVSNNGDLFTTTTDDTTNYSKGAIAKVLYTNDFVTKGIVGSIDANVTRGIEPIDANNSIIFRYETMNGKIYEGTERNATTLGALVTLINAELDDFNITNTTAAAQGADSIRFSTSGVEAELANVLLDFNVTAFVASEGNVTVNSGTLVSDATAKTSDLRTNAWYAPNYVQNGPLYTLNEAGYKLKALVSGATRVTDGSLAWESIDLTRTPAQWTASQEYNLLQTDKYSGYWAYLESTTTGGTLSATVTATPSAYTTYYDGTTARTFVKGNIYVTVSGADALATTYSTISVVATVGGATVNLTSTDNVTFTGEAVLEELTGTDTTAPLSVTAVVTDGLGNKYPLAPTTLATSMATGSQPSAPSASLNATGGLDINGTATGYAVFYGPIPESDAMNAANKITSSATVSSASITGLCSSSATTVPLITDTQSALNVVAIAGNGVIDDGLVSNVTSIPYMPITKAATSTTKIVVTDAAGNDGSPAIGGTPYDSSCTASTAVATNDYRVQVESLSLTYPVKLAYTVIEDLGLSVPVTWYVQDAAGVKALITYDEQYAGDTAFIMLGGTTYGITFPQRVDAELYSIGSPQTISANNKGVLSW
jgi:hypothetical protein